MALHVTALFNDRLTAHAAIEQLVQAGFPRDVISVVMSERTHDREVAMRSGVRSASGAPPSSSRSGGVLASIVVSLVEMGEGILGVGPLAAPGALDGGLEHLEHVRAGALLVAVTTAHDTAQLARQVLELAGGEALAA
jgi:hypothetical protein